MTENKGYNSNKSVGDLIRNFLSSRCQKKKKLFDILMDQISECSENNLDRNKKLFLEKFSKKTIVDALVESDIVKNPDSLLGKIQICYNLHTVHKVNHWRKYFFRKEYSSELSSTLYRVDWADSSGMLHG